MGGVGKILSTLGTGLLDFSTGLAALDPLSLSIILGDLISDLDDWIGQKLQDEFGEFHAETTHFKLFAL